VSLAPSLTEIVFALGAGDRVVGVDDHVDFPEAVRSLPRVGGFLNPNIERILSLSPDLVMMVHSFRAANERLEGAGLRTALIPNESLADLDAAVAAVGTLLGAATEAERVRGQIKLELEAVRSEVADRPRPRVAFILDRQTGTLADLYIAGRASFLSALVEVAGGENVFADVAHGAARIGVEEILRRAPEVILDSARGDPAPVWRTLPSIPAVRSGRVLALSERWVTIPGPRVGAAARRIADLLHPGRDEL
jgi:iron complex transport system substrate-binding protein